MKSIKRIFSSILVVAMLISLISVNVAATGNIEIKFTSPQPVLGGTEQTVNVDLEMVNNPGIVGFKANFSYDETNLELVSFEDKGVLKGYNGYSDDNPTKVLTWKDTAAKKNNTATGVLGTLTFKVKANAPVNDYQIKLEPVKEGMLDVDLEEVNTTATNGVIKVTEKTNISDNKNVTASVAYGADLKAALPEKVTFNTKTTVSKADGTQEFDVNWNTDGKSTAPEIDGVKKLNSTNNTITVEGTPVITGNTFDANGKKAIATVTITPIEGGSIAPVTADLKEQKTAPDAEAAQLELVKTVLPTEINVSKGDGKNAITDSVPVEWTKVNGYVNEVSKSFTVTGTVGTVSKNGLFTFATGTIVTATVKVVSAEVEGGTITVDNAAKYGNATVKFTIPAAAELKENDEITASIYAQDSATKGIAATALETSAPIKVTKEEAGKEYTNSIKFSSFDTLKLDTNNVFYVKVFVNGAPLLNGTGKDAKDYVESYVLPESNRRPNNGGGNGGGTVVVKKHDVKVTEGTNGTATVDKEAKVGDTVKVDVKPNEGYKVKEIIVKTADGKTVEVDQKNRTFVMPDGNVTVEVVYEEGTEEPTVADGKFTDVPDTFWAAADIYTLKEAGIINGKSDKEFDPEGKVTRAEFTKMIVNLFGVKASQNTVAFTDCKADDWFTPFVAAAVEAGYVKGITDTEFAPDKTITREEACTILGRAYAKTSDKALNFTDASGISDFATAYVALLVDMGYVNGYEDGTFLPKNEITRAEAAKIIASAFRAAEKAKTEVTEDKTEAKDNADADVKADDKTDAKADDKAEVKADDKKDAKADAKTDAKADNGETPEK